MPNTWFTADFHFGHANIIRYFSRPFRTVEEMDQAILERPNICQSP
jgi:calcineurin-like phosphoesterase family protein